MKIEIYGTRGSLPTPGEHTRIFGGNTACVELTLNNGAHFILDAGTGIVALGDKLATNQDPITILLSHNHWDHIQGFPFFKPIYQKGRRIQIIPGAVTQDEPDAILTQMSGSTFPVKYSQLEANITLATHLTGVADFELEQCRISTLALNHPDGGSAYRFVADQRTFVYATDNELEPPGKATTSFNQWINFVQGADLLIHDAQYLGQELNDKHGWGHSAYEQAATLAERAGVKHLALFSHDPQRNDEELLHQEQLLQAKYKQKFAIECLREGRIIQL